MLSQPGDFQSTTGHESWAMGTLTHGKKPCTHCTRGRVGPGASHYTVMKMVEQRYSTFLNFAIDGCQWFTLCPGCHNPMK